MWILNIFVFGFASENGTLILCCKKITLSFIKKFDAKAKSPPPPLSTQFPFSPTPPFLEKIYHPHPYCHTWGTQPPPSFIKGSMFLLFLDYYFCPTIWVLELCYYCGSSFLTTFSVIIYWVMSKYLKGGILKRGRSD